MPVPTPAKEITDRLLAAVASRDLRRIEASLSLDCRWQNVPSPAVMGREAVVDMLGRIVTWSDRVEWDVVSAAYHRSTAWLERADRFWIGGDEYTVLCNGVFEVDLQSEQVMSVRDYVDLGEWRSRLAPVLAAMSQRSAAEVISRHVRAVEDRDPVAMAADYSPDAVLRRSGHHYRGWRAIADYFDTVPHRLGSNVLGFERSSDSGSDHPETDSLSWTITTADGSVVAAGTDTYVVAAGRIVEQDVELDTVDF